MLETLLIIALATTGGTELDGEVAATSGVVTLRRAANVYQAGPRAYLRPGDRVETAAGGGATLMLPGGGALDLGPGAAVTLGGADGRAVEIPRGEARAIVDGAPLTLLSAGGRIVIARGIVRAAATDGGVRVWAEAGAADVAGASGRALALATGQEATLPQGRDPAAPVAARPEGWLIRPEGLRLATAAETSRRAKGRLADEANNDAAKAFLSSGQAGVRAGTPESTTPDEATQPTPTPDDTTQPTPAANPEGENEDTIGSNSSVTQPAATSAISLALGNSSAAIGAGSSGGDFSDAQQDSLTSATVVTPTGIIPLAGNIHVIAAQSRYTLGDVRLSSRDRFPVEREYWSIGLGPTPTHQVVTTFRTGSDLVPQTLRIPRTDAYLIRFPQSNYGIRDPANGGVGTDVTGISGLLGAVPVAPQVQGATPLLDSRAIFNDRATFALGEFALQRSSKDQPQIDIRRGDQDRQIIKSPIGNDQQDRVTLNPQVKFEAVRDPKFFPQLPAVSRPAPNNPVSNKPTYASLDPLRKAAATTLLADRLSDFSRRTGRTRFVLGAQVVDITGYRPANPIRELMRPPTIGVRGATAAARRPSPIDHHR